MNRRHHNHCAHTSVAFCARCNVAYCKNCPEQWYTATVNIPSIWPWWGTYTEPTLAPFTVTSNGTAPTYITTSDHTGH